MVRNVYFEAPSQTHRIIIPKRRDPTIYVFTSLLNDSESYWCRTSGSTTLPHPHKSIFYCLVHPQNSKVLKIWGQQSARKPDFTQSTAFVDRACNLAQAQYPSRMSCRYSPQQSQVGTNFSPSFVLFTSWVFYLGKETGWFMIFLNVC